MKTKGLFFASLTVAALLVIFAVLTAQRMPPDAMLPTHWNAAGQADAFAAPLQAMLMPPGLLLILAALFAAIPRIEPLQNRLAGSAPVLTATWIGMILLMIVISATIGLPGWGIEPPINTVMIGAGLLLVILGNALPKSRPGFFVGIRTPWAILDTDNWIATHRLGGKLMMGAGLVILIAALLPIPAEAMTWIVLGTVLTAAFAPFAYSWWLWQKSRPSQGDKI